MHISKHDANLLLILLGVIIFVGGYFAVYNPTTGKTEAVETEISALQPTLTELRDHQAKLGTYEAGIAEFRDVIAGEMALYPSAVRPEDFIMYAIELEEKTGLDVTNIGFEEPVMLAQFDSIREEGSQQIVTPLTAFEYGVTMNCSLSYEELKDLIKHIDDTALSTKLDTVSVSFDSENGGLVGSATVDKYYITSGSEPYVPTQVPDVSLGTEDIFATFTAVPAETVPAVTDTEG